MTVDNRRCDAQGCLEPELTPVQFEAAYRQIVGFDPPPRHAGGQNTVALKRYTGKLMCSRCMENQKRGLASGQGTLT